MRLADVLMIYVPTHVWIALGRDSYSEYSLSFDNRYVGCRTQSR